MCRDRRSDAVDARVPQDPLSLATPRATRAVLSDFGLAPKKRLGQNFLVSRWVLERVLKNAALSSNDIAFEVGPGIGTLTRGLLARAKAVVAVERDEALTAVLARTCAFGWDRLALIVGDATRVDESMVAQALFAKGIREEETRQSCLPNVFVSNLPYGVAATVILNVFTEMPSIDRATVMVQREVAERMAARPATKVYGAYSAKLALFSRIDDRFDVGPREFWPEPHVGSTVLSLKRKVRICPEETKAIFACIECGFAQRRKTLRNNLLSAGFSRETIVGAFAEVGLSPECRAEELSPETFVELSRCLSRLSDVSGEVSSKEKAPLRTQKGRLRAKGSTKDSQKDSQTTKRELGDARCESATSSHLVSSGEERCL